MTTHTHDGHALCGMPAVLGFMAHFLAAKEGTSFAVKVGFNASNTGPQSVLMIMSVGDCGCQFALTAPEVEALVSLVNANIDAMPGASKEHALPMLAKSLTEALASVRPGALN